MKSTIQRAWGNPFKDTLSPLSADLLDDHAVSFQQHLAALRQDGPVGNMEHVWVELTRPGKHTKSDMENGL